MCLAFIKEQTYKQYRLNSLYKYIKMYNYKGKENEIMNKFEQIFTKIKIVLGINEIQSK